VYRLFLPLSQALRLVLLAIGNECRNVTALIHQLQLPHLSLTQQAEILAELLSATIHLHTHCDAQFQDLIAEEMEMLPDSDDNNRSVATLLTGSDRSTPNSIILFLKALQVPES